MLLNLYAPIGQRQDRQMSIHLIKEACAKGMTDCLSWRTAGCWWTRQVSASMSTAYPHGIAMSTSTR